jgi:hypothetical protein
MPALPVWIKKVFTSCIVIGLDTEKLLESFGFLFGELRFWGVSVRMHAYTPKSEDSLGNSQ